MRLLEFNYKFWILSCVKLLGYSSRKLLGDSSRGYLSFILKKMWLENKNKWREERLRTTNEREKQKKKKLSELFQLEQNA